MIKDYFVHMHKRQIKAEQSVLIHGGLLGVFSLFACFFFCFKRLDPVMLMLSYPKESKRRISF